LNDDSELLTQERTSSNTAKHVMSLKNNSAQRLLGTYLYERLGWIRRQ